MCAMVCQSDFLCWRHLAYVLSAKILSYNFSNNSVEQDSHDAVSHGQSSLSCSNLTNFFLNMSPHCKLGCHNKGVQSGCWSFAVVKVYIVQQAADGHWAQLAVEDYSVNSTRNETALASLHIIWLVQKLTCVTNRIMSNVMVLLHCWYIAVGHRTKWWE